MMAKRIAITLGTAVLSFIAFHFILGEISVAYEMWTTNTTEREQLADDFGLDVIWIFIVIPLSTLLSFIVGFIAWKKSGIKRQQ